MTRKITQAELAKKVGLSETTVSLVLNNRPFSISERNRQRILELAEKSGYFNKTPALQRTGLICYLILQDVNNPYYHRFFIGIEKEMNRHNYHILISSCDVRRSFLERIIARVDGFIVQGHRLLSEAFVEYLNRRRPTVLLNYTFPNKPYDSVMPDNASGVRKAIRYLYQLGHRYIGFFGMRPLQLHHEERYQAYRATLKDLGLEIRDEMIYLPVVKERTMEATEPYIAQFLSSIRKLRPRPTALFCPWDGHTLTILKLAPGVGISIPEDLSLIGFDYDQRCLSVLPTLSSVNQPMEEMGTQASRFLMERIADPERPPRKLVLDVELKIHQSVAKPKQ